MLGVDLAAPELHGALGGAHEHVLGAVAEIALDSDAFGARCSLGRYVLRRRCRLAGRAAHEQGFEWRERALMSRQFRIVEVANIENVPAAIAQDRQSNGGRTGAAYIAHMRHGSFPCLLTSE